MKNWLLKWRIALAHDERRALPPDLAQAVKSKAELHRFAARTEALGRELKETRPTVTPPPTLHAAIMRRVQAEQLGAGEGQGEEALGLIGRISGTRYWLGARWLPATALATVLLIALLGILFFRAPRADSAAAVSPLAVADAELETGGDWVRSVPAAALLPLAQENARLRLDWTNAQAFLLASLP